MEWRQSCVFVGRFNYFGSAFRGALIYIFARHVRCDSLLDYSSIVRVITFILISAFNKDALVSCLHIV